MGGILQLPETRQRLAGRSGVSASDGRTRTFRLLQLKNIYLDHCFLAILQGACKRASGYSQRTTLVLRLDKARRWLGIAAELQPHDYALLDSAQSI